ncbi:hypothetical protein F511_43506 [Dorcoceras hygrometricum]|uniref:Uncharacterized protein n=1 Tax=Dorcoceras hygrometricum TaxID=472368 RepID=A0A2Z7AVX3_9LAMI|nr:hypothetical protein F511_43506 [Dorcoceras hygrometricum]
MAARLSQKVRLPASTSAGLMLRNVLRMAADHGRPACCYSIEYPRMSASGESSTTMHRLLHASGSHPIPPPNDPKASMSFRVVRTNQYNQDLGLIHSTNGNHLESPNEGSSIDHQFPPVDRLTSSLLIPAHVSAPLFIFFFDISPVEFIVSVPAGSRFLSKYHICLSNLASA